MTRARALAPFAVLACLAALAGGCDNDDFARIDVTDQRGPGAARLDFVSGISIPEGAVVSAHIDFYDHDNDFLTGDLQSEDPTVLQIAHTTTDSQSFAFLGVKAGTTSVHLIADGKQVRSVTAVVTAP